MIHLPSMSAKVGLGRRFKSWAHLLALFSFTKWCTKKLNSFCFAWIRVQKKILTDCKYCKSVWISEDLGLPAKTALSHKIVQLSCAIKDKNHGISCGDIVQFLAFIAIYDKQHTTNFSLISYEHILMNKHIFHMH